jgi:hypothetical protein
VRLTMKASPATTDPSRNASHLGAGKGACTRDRAGVLPQQSGCTDRAGRLARPRQENPSGSQETCCAGQASP